MAGCVAGLCYLAAGIVMGCLAVVAMSIPLAAFLACVVGPICSYLFGYLYSFAYPFLTGRNNLVRFIYYDEPLNPFQTWLFVLYSCLLLGLFILYARKVHCFCRLMFYLLERDKSMDDYIFKDLKKAFPTCVKPTLQKSVAKVQKKFASTSVLEYLENSF